MKKALFTVAAGAALALGMGQAMADGLPERRHHHHEHQPPCEHHRFHGFYVGANVGSATLTAHQNDLDGFLKDTAGYTARDTGVTGGVQVGYNHQRNCTVFGVEADWNWARLRANTQLEPNDPGVVDSSLRTRVDWFGTLRTRTGIVVDHTLFYLTGGLAWANVRNRIADIDVGEPQEVFTSRDTRWGWTAGVGVEHALSDRISIKSEVLYLSFDEKSHQFHSNFVGSDFRIKDVDDIWVARVGLNFSFGRRHEEPMK